MSESLTSLIGIKLGSEFGVLKDQFLRFDPMFKISFSKKDGQTIILIEFEDNYLPNFFGNKVHYLSGIVGKNGVGKSTTLRYIKELFVKENRDFDPRVGDVIFFIDDGIIKIFFNQYQREDFVVENATVLAVEEIHFRDYPKVLDRIKNFSTIYYSNSLETDYYEKETINYYNVSTGFLKEQIGKINSRIRSKRIRFLGGNKRYKYTELKRQSEFLKVIDELDGKLDIPFKGIENILLNLHVMSKNDYEKFLKNTIVSIEDKFDGVDNHEVVVPQFIENLSQFVKSLQIRMDNLRSNNGSALITCRFLFYENLIQFLLKLVFDDQKLITAYSDDFHLAYEVLDVFKQSDFLNEDFSKIYRLINQLSDFYNKNEKFEKIYQRNLNTTKRPVIVEKLEEIGKLEQFFRKNWDEFTYHKYSLVFSTKSSLFLEFFDKHYGVALDMPFIDLKWPSLSAGEESLIAYFSRLYSVLGEIKNKNVLMLIDEGDLYFHPEWQRDYVYFLLEFLNSDIFEAKSIQIIITTHSPFIISDLPKENISLLVKANSQFGDSTVLVKTVESNTFGGNIHTLFSEAFFLGDVVTSRFAKKKIKEEIITPLIASEPMENSEHIKRLIGRVGEPVLRSILEERYIKKIND